MSYPYNLDRDQLAVIVKGLRALPLMELPFQEAATAVKLINLFHSPDADQMIIARRARKVSRDEQPVELILAYLPKNEATPWVTWVRNNPDRGGDGTKFWGNYHADYQSAAHDFKTRKF